MKKPSSLKTWIWLIVIIAAMVIGYLYYSGSSGLQSRALLQSDDMASDVVGAQVISLLNQIQSLKIDDSVFNDPGYRTLQDYSVAIPPQPVGRPNPFAPISGASSASSAAAASAN